MKPAIPNEMEHHILRELAKGGDIRRICYDLSPPPDASATNAWYQCVAKGWIHGERLTLSGQTWALKLRRSPLQITVIKDAPKAPLPPIEASEEIPS